MSLLERAVQYLETDTNVAYFCRFDRETATKGEETLYVGDTDFYCYNEVDLQISGLLESSFEGNSTLPILIPYDFVTQVFRNFAIRRSGWPVLMGFIPDHIVQGTITRKESDRIVPSRQSEADREFSLKIADVRKRIIEGDLLQVVLSRKQRIPVLDPIERVKSFLNDDRSLYVFLYRIGDYLVVGSSPENLITLDGTRAEIYPIAGTVPRGRTVREDEELRGLLLNSEKDRLEHRMLVDLARNDLGKISVGGSVEVRESMILRKYISVQHLVSHVVSTLEDQVRVMDILKAVFPAGTVSGAPKRRAVEFIEKMENEPRGGYGGAAGIIERGKLDLALLIRSLFRFREIWESQAGAGIVKDSDPELEAREVAAKLLTATGGVEYECLNH